jgi:serine protease Do
MSFVEQSKDVAARVLDRAGASVVRIGRAGRGAGIVVADGLVVTSAHNLRGSETTVAFADGRAVVGTAAGVDGEGDLAAISVDTGGAPAIEWGDPEVAVGTSVVALARPLGAGTRVTFGTVSAVARAFRGPQGRLITDGVEHTAPVGRGSSGGPLTDVEGRLVAINTHRLGDGLYLALPATAALRARIEGLGRGETPRRLRLGVALASPHAAQRLRAAVGLPPREGLLVRGVEDGSPAARAGVSRGDLIVAAGGQPVASLDQLQRALDGVDVGQTLGLTVVRGAEELTLTVSFEPPQD